MRRFAALFYIMTVITLSCSGEKVNLSEKKNVIVYRETGRFAGWPSNYGIWSWGDEIVTGFNLGYLKKKEGHAIDPDKSRVMRFARSTDGGQSWSVEAPNFLDEQGNEPEPVPCPGGFDFSDPGFAIMLRYGSFYISADRCKNWAGPYQIPEFEGRRNRNRTEGI